MGVNTNDNDEITMKKVLKGIDKDMKDLIYRRHQQLKVGSTRRVNACKFGF